MYEWWRNSISVKFFSAYIFATRGVIFLANSTRRTGKYPSGNEVSPCGWADYDIIYPHNYLPATPSFGWANIRLSIAVFVFFGVRLISLRDTFRIRLYFYELFTCNKQEMCHKWTSSNNYCDYLFCKLNKKNAENWKK